MSEQEQQLARTKLALLEKMAEEPVSKRRRNHSIQWFGLASLSLLWALFSALKHQHFGIEFGVVLLAISLLAIPWALSARAGARMSSSNSYFLGILLPLVVGGIALIMHMETGAEVPGIAAALRCAMHGSMMGFVAGTAALFVIRKSCPGQYRSVAMVIFAWALLFSSAMLNLACPSHDWHHLILGHLSIPIGASISWALLLGRRILAP